MPYTLAGGRVPEHCQLTQLCIDSRKAAGGSLFAAIKGTKADGHDYIATALEQGAEVILMDSSEKNRLAALGNLEEKCLVLTENPALALGQMASAFYGHPSRKLTLVATTGTNGKTTTVFLQQQLFEALGYKTGMLSTIENRIGQHTVAATLTTPDVISINQMLAQMLEAGVSYCFMEASSHAIIQERIAGLHFSGALFTNITHDHLDYHGTFNNYIKAKKKLFDQLPKTAFALVNADDRRSGTMLQNCVAMQHTFALKNMADFKGKLLANTADGLQMEIEHSPVWFRLIGSFNAYNLLGVYATAILLGENAEKVLQALSQLKGARGRFEQITSADGVKAIVDYAHTPDALENVLKTLVDLRQNRQLITVVGCGGNRDKSKRPIMASIAAKYSDKLILTSDNPRDENPENIIKEMVQGLPAEGKQHVQTITDRSEAILTACQDMAQTGDIVLVAGKGHETYQEIAGKRYHFDDKEIIKQAFTNRKPLETKPANSKK